MANILDEALREIYRERMGRDPLQGRVKFLFSCFIIYLHLEPIQTEDKL